MMLSAYVGGLGVLGPGLSNWPETAAVLSGEQAYRPAATILPMPTILAAAERRRVGRVVKLAIGVALEATSQAGEDPADLASVFGPTTPCSSTKGATGHTLGAAGALEAVISALALQHGLMPGGVHTNKIDPTLTALYIRENRRAPVARVLSNSFGFGGTNCSLILGRAG